MKLPTEARANFLYHYHFLPILISPIVLRSRGLGQVDLCFLDFDKVYQIEVKTFHNRSTMFILPEQSKRLRRTSRWLAHIFEKIILLRYLKDLDLQNLSKKELLAKL